MNWPLHCSKHLQSLDQPYHVAVSLYFDRWEYVRFFCNPVYHTTADVAKPMGNNFKEKHFTQTCVVNMLLCMKHSIPKCG